MYKKVFGAIFLLFAPIEPSKATQIKVVVKQEMHFHAKITLKEKKNTYLSFKPAERNLCKNLNHIDSENVFTWGFKRPYKGLKSQFHKIFDSYFFRQNFQRCWYRHF